MEKSLFTRKFGLVGFIFDAVCFWFMVFLIVEMVIELRVTSIVALGYIFVVFLIAPLLFATLAMNIAGMVKKQFTIAEIIGYIAFAITLITPVVVIFLARGGLIQ